MLEIDITDIKKTQEIGKKLGSILSGGEVIILDGDLGAGKTTFAQNIAVGLEIDEHIISPTYNIVNEYYGRIKLNHFDVYRIETIEELFEIGFQEYIYSEGVSIIEWGNLIDEEIPKERLELKIYFKENKRHLVIKGIGERYKNIEKELEI